MFAEGPCGLHVSVRRRANADPVSLGVSLSQSLSALVHVNKERGRRAVETSHPVDPVCASVTRFSFTRTFLDYGLVDCCPALDITATARVNGGKRVVLYSLNVRREYAACERHACQAALDVARVGFSGLDAGGHCKHGGMRRSSNF